MIYPRYWIRHAVARRALRGYPVYDVPHKDAEGKMGEARAQENFDYFMRVRLGRLAYFTGWLRKNFGVEAILNGEGLQAVSRWTEAYGGGLIGGDDFLTMMKIYGTYQPRWEGALAGYNVMIDIGIFEGEYLIVKRPRLRWEIYRGHEIEPETFNSIDFMKPCLGCDGLLLKQPSLSVGCSSIANGRAISTMGSINRTRSLLIANAQSILHATKVPYVIGDYRNEPI
jgi:hypothetical protein